MERTVRTRRQAEQKERMKNKGYKGPLEGDITRKNQIRMFHVSKIGNEPPLNKKGFWENPHDWLPMEAAFKKGLKL